MMNEELKLYPKSPSGIQSHKIETENKLETDPINKLLVTVSFPLILSMLVQALYNVVDSLYVSRLSQEAFNAVSLSFPIQNILSAITSGTGVGVVTLVSRSLGEKDWDKANRYAANGAFLILCSYVIILLFGLFGVDIFFRSQTEIPEIIEGGKQYLSICCCLSFGIFGQTLMERLLQSTGKSIFSMVTQAVSAGTNIILDSIFIFGYLGIPAMGVAGAAVATVLGQILGMTTGLVLHHVYNKEIRIAVKGFHPSIQMILGIYKVGVPSMVTIGLGSVMTYMMNRLLITIEATATAAAVLGSYFKLQSFVNLPVFGLSNGMQPIASYNLGAKKKSRVLRVYRLSVLYALVIMCIGASLFILVPDKLLALFSASEYMLSIGIPAFRTISVSFIMAGYTLTTINFFTACSRSSLSLLTAFCRQLVVLVPLGYLIGYTLGYQYVWFAIPIAEACALLITVFGYLRLNHDILSKLPDNT